MSASTPESLDEAGDGVAATSAPAPDELSAAAAELLTAQSRLRGLLAINQSLVGGASARDVAQQLVEAACAVAGARYARLELDRGDGPPQVLEHAADTERLAFYRRYLDQQPGPAADAQRDGPAGGIGHFTVALANGQRRVGVLQVLDRECGGLFTELTQELLTTLAATATLILDRASQYEQVQRRVDWLEALRRVEKLVISSDDELPVWSEIADRLQRLTSSSAVVLQVPGDNDDMHVLVAAGARAHSMQGVRYPKEESLGWRSMQQGRGQVLPSGADLPQSRHSLADPRGVGPVMSVPLVGDRGARGAVALMREVDQLPFSDADLELVEDFARQATVALELAEARSARNRLVQTEAREVIARELHDEVIQRLFGVGLGLQGVTRAEPETMQLQLQQTVCDLDATIVQIRETIFSLRSNG